jgi:hypothetical protein
MRRRMYIQLVPFPLTAFRPIFAQDKWETAQTLPHGKVLLPLNLSETWYSSSESNTGHWTGDNPVVWAALKPVLQLVSKFLTEMHTSIWVSYPPLFLGLSINFPLDRLHRQEVVIRTLGKNFTLSICTRSVHPKDNQTPTKKLHDGMTVTYEDKTGITLAIANEIILPLLRNDLVGAGNPCPNLSSLSSQQSIIRLLTTEPLGITTGKVLPGSDFAA